MKQEIKNVVAISSKQRDGLAQAYAECVLHSVYNENTTEVKVEYDVLFDMIKNAWFMGFTEAGGGSFETLSSKNLPQSYLTVLLLNSKNQPVLGYYDKKGGGMRMFGTEKWGGTKEYGVPVKWRRLV